MGTLSRIEKELIRKNRAQIAVKDQDLAASSKIWELLGGNEDTPFVIANSWSINPTSLDQITTISNSLGIII